MSDTHEPLPDKREVARALLLRGSVFVHLDPRHHGVMVPQHLRKQPQLVLQVGLDMAVPIPDLRVDQEGVTGTLSFNRSPFTCFVPWEAVFALAGDDARGMVWPPSMPPEIKSEIDRETGRMPPPALALAEEDYSSEDATDADEPSGNHDNVFDLSSRRPKPRLVPAPSTAEEDDSLSEAAEADDIDIDDGDDASADPPGPSEAATDARDGSEPDDTDGPPEDEPPRPRGHLRLIK